MDEKGDSAKKNAWSTWNPIGSSSNLINKALEKSKEQLAKVQTTLNSPDQQERTSTDSLFQNLIRNPTDSLLRKPTSNSKQSFEQPLIEDLQQNNSPSSSPGRFQRSLSSSSVDTLESTNDIPKLKQYELKLGDLAKAYKSLQKKNNQIEAVLVRNTPVESINTPSDLENAENFIKELKLKNTIFTDDINKFTKQISELQEIQKLEAQAKSEMFEALQNQLTEKNKEVQKLKLNVDNSPISPKQQPLIDFSEDDNLQKKNKELTVLLKKTTEQRNKAIEKLKEISEKEKSIVEPNLIDISPFNRTEELERQIKSLIASHQSELQTLQHELNLTKTNNENLEMANAELKTQLTQNSNIFNDSNDTNFPTQIKSLEFKLETIENEKLKLQNLVSVQQDKISSLTQMIEKSGNLIQNASVGSTHEIDSFRSCTSVFDEEAMKSQKQSVEYSNLLKEVEALRLEKQKLEISSSKEITCLKDNVSNLTKELNNLKVANDSKKTSEELKELEKKLADAISNAERKSNLAEKLVLKVRGLEQKLLDTTQTAEKSMALQDNIKQLEVELQNYKDRLQAENEAHMALNEKYAELEQNFETKSKKFEEDWKQVVHLEENLNATTKSLNDLEVAHDRSKKELNDQLKITEKFEKLLAEKDSSLLKIENQLNLISSDSDENLAQLKIKTQHLEGLDKEKAFLQEELNLLKISEKKLNDELKKLSKEKFDMEEVVKSLEKEKSNFQEQLKHFNSLDDANKSDVHNLKEEMKKLTLKIESLDNVKVELENNINAFIAKEKSYEAQLISSNDKLLKAEKSYSESKSENNVLSTELETVKNQLQRSNTLCEELRGQLNNGTENTDGSFTELEFKLKDERDKVDKLELELKLSNNLVEELKKKVELLEKNNSELKEELKKVAALKEEEKQKLTSDYENKLKGSAEELRKLEFKAAELKQNFNALEQSKDLKIKEISEAREQLSKQITELQATNAKVYSEMEAVNKNLELNTTEKDEVLSEFLLVQSALDTKSKLLTETENSYNQLKLNSETSKSELTQLNLDLNKLNEEKQVAINTVKELEAEIQSLRGFLEAKNAEVIDHSADNELKELREKVGVLEKAVEESRQASAEASQLKSEMESKLEASEGALALAKKQIYERDNSILEFNEQLKSTKQALTEEEEKKNKSIGLLRNSKARILKLESDAKSKSSEIEKANEYIQEKEKLLKEKDLLLKEKEKQMSTLTRQVEDMNSRLKKHDEGKGDLEKKKKEMTAEVEQLNNKITQLLEAQTVLCNEKDALTSLLQSKEQEWANSTSVLNHHQDLLRSYPITIKELETRIHNLDQDLETSNRLFETKSIENDQFKLRISELETKIYDTEESENRKHDEIEQYKRDIKELRKELHIKNSEIKKIEYEIKEVKLSANQKNEESEKKIIFAEKSLEILDNLNDELKTLTETVNNLEKDIAMEKKKNSELVSLMESKQQEYRESLKEKDNLYEEIKVREVQTKNVCKALKEEVRKLSKSILTSNVSGSTQNLGNGSPINSGGRSSVVEERSSTFESPSSTPTIENYKQ
ncbi:hypothetical protein HK099_002506, partial [Clydaea vesicula]